MKTGYRVKATMGNNEAKIVYWRRELWDRCYRELANAEIRLVQEVARLGGHCAHVHDEAIDPNHDDTAGEAWLHGRFSDMLYRRQQESR